MGYRVYKRELNNNSVAVAMFAGGSGTAEDPYLVGHAHELYNVGVGLCINKYFKQIADIDLSGYFTGAGWEPIGDDNTPFTGCTFDGAGHTISNLFIDRSETGWDFRQHN